MGRPIINYIGNKYRYGKLLDDLCLIPKQIDNYVEPFVGGAGFLCYLNETRTIKKIIINDKDCMLINFYKHFKKSPEKFKEVLNNKTTETSFKKHKELLSNFKPNLECAVAYFVIKNCSYNSQISRYKNGDVKSYISEMNKKNFNNGSKTKSLENFQNILNKTFISCIDYKKIIPKKSFIFLDPPYILKHISDYYMEHSIDLNELYEYFTLLCSNKNKILLTLNYDLSIVKKFKKYNQYIYSKNATHSTNSQVLKELVITNY